MVLCSNLDHGGFSAMIDFLPKGVRGAHLLGESPLLHVTNQNKPRQLHSNTP
ncbi:hypothetical protein HanIR_Chr06g0262831 [Helianthus annuus]|nr:hypothetical protein HanIR_Chr06g0262831 [Helianthus annuus]